MDEGLQGFLTGGTLISLFMVPIIYFGIRQERTTCRKRVERAEGFLSEGELVKAYEEVKHIGERTGQMYAARKVRKRAKEIRATVENSDLVKQVRKEVYESLGGATKFHKVYLNLDWGNAGFSYGVDGILGNPKLEDLSETYREHFLSDPSKSSSF